jgi:hypothetical protein
MVGVNRGGMHIILNDDDVEVGIDMHVATAAISSSAAAVSVVAATTAVIAAAATATTTTTTSTTADTTAPPLTHHDSTARQRQETSPTPPWTSSSDTICSFAQDRCDHCVVALIPQVVTTPGVRAAESEQDYE